jgi:hypothetical protein
MKKLGTPIGAAPGSAKEKVGFDGVGTPAPVTGDLGLLGVLALGLPGVLVGLLGVVGVVVGPWWEGFWTLPGPVVFGGLDGVDVVPDPEVDVEPEPEPEG